MSLVHKIFRRFIYVFKGIAYAVHKDASFKMQFYLGLIFVIIFGYVVSPLTQSEFIWLTLSWILVLITELQNSAFELALDRLHPEHHDNIGKSKDMAAGAVFIAGLFAFVVVVTIVLHRI